MAVDKKQCFLFLTFLDELGKIYKHPESKWVLGRICGFSSSGRASASQAEGGEFEPRNPLHSQRQDVCSGAFLFWGFTMLPPRESVVRPLCRGCFGERVTSSDGCGQNRHEKTTVRRHRGDPSRFKAALFFSARQLLREGASGI